jgi:hypothetical protein
MGQTISSIIGDPKKDEETAKDALNSLMELAKAKSIIFNEQILASKSNNMEIPINKILIKDYTIKASVSSDSKNLADSVKSTIGNFANGDFVDGITDVLKVGLNALFGNFSGSTSEKQLYLISVGPLGGIFRIDYYMYSYRFQSKTLRDYASNVVTVSYVVSSVETKDLDLNTLIDIVQICYSGIDVEKQKTILEMLKKEIIKTY